MSLEVHCEICANISGDIRISSDTLIARVDPESVSLPLYGSMFGSVNPDRGIPPPWHPTLTWEVMSCPRNPLHLPWLEVGDEHKLAKLNEQGGPSYLLTNRGRFDLNGKGFEEEEFKHQEDLEDEWNRRVKGSELEQMCKMREAGATWPAIGKHFGVSKDTARRKVLGIGRGGM